MVNVMQWAVRTVLQRANAITLVMHKDNKNITNSTLKLSIVTCKRSTVMDILYIVIYIHIMNNCCYDICDIRQIYITQQ